MIKVHALIIDALYKKYRENISWLGWLFWPKIRYEQMQKSLIDDLGTVYQEIHSNIKFAIPLGNFPDLDHMKVGTLLNIQYIFFHSEFE